MANRCPGKSVAKASSDNSGGAYPAPYQLSSDPYRQSSGVNLPALPNRSNPFRFSSFDSSIEEGKEEIKDPGHLFDILFNHVSERMNLLLQQ
jgi:hypothetical protein